MEQLNSCLVVASDEKIRLRKARSRQVLYNSEAREAVDDVLLRYSQSVWKQMPTDLDPSNSISVHVSLVKRMLPESLAKAPPAVLQLAPACTDLAALKLMIQRVTRGVMQPGKIFLEKPGNPNALIQIMEEMSLKDQNVVDGDLLRVEAEPTHAQRAAVWAYNPLVDTPTAPPHTTHLRSPRRLHASHRSTSITVYQRHQSASAGGSITRLSAENDGTCGQIVSKDLPTNAGRPSSTAAAKAMGPQSSLRSKDDPVVRAATATAEASAAVAAARSSLLQSLQAQKSPPATSGSIRMSTRLSRGLSSGPTGNDTAAVDTAPCALPLQASALVSAVPRHMSPPMQRAGDRGSQKRLKVSRPIAQGALSDGERGEGLLEPDGGEGDHDGEVILVCEEEGTIRDHQRAVNEELEEEEDEGVYDQLHGTQRLSLGRQKRVCWDTECTLKFLKGVKKYYLQSSPNYIGTPWIRILEEFDDLPGDNRSLKDKYVNIMHAVERKFLGCRNSSLLSKEVQALAKQIYEEKMKTGQE
ncbi:hypothetical protein CEUSTIGMA_g10174.t1 [Chlamydomonas eustigma]|uniref:Uncharacterized protein n=1 Tax=Chlamydomonas eustigma TaxID=1157962 RepID=A0A250XI46_9CHLO|nr:hypothetical protein CEUSTIGMA_g10174.t1 [Chlamydomonas eustigma]|eukprot:GAX82748.1 hypothetical protein CEUSTIGMA_g10174.t1 [Chlamydomonas eustigma]